MKKISFFALFMLLSLGIEAQVKVVSPHPDIKVKFLRCIESGGTAVIEFTVNNLSNQDKEFNLSSCCGYSTSYDDEGNLYEDANIQISDRIGPAISIVFPSNIPVKCKLHIEKISQYATEFSKATLGLLLRGEYKSIEFFNIPIVRD
ncbi:hypothetical protein [Bacteroides fragilis]|jgi:hypothetical protein|uniref:hypothetical protein n=1 Tax=Bacteroides fragilis TaxID=817 RepID=UPI00044B1A62|nr:hypothetical protein [Bacteroides fragilis]EXZ04270.1 hypothetical protein M072_3374 [Bacteroides fragilis str. DS-208]MCE8972621.1 hypothetical protein [Bacteroides fragilis]